MNFKRGFFRFWILASTIWLVSFGFAGASNISEAIAYWRGTATVLISTGKEEIIFPVSATVEQVESAIRQGVTDGMVTVPTTQEVRRKYPQYNDMSDADLAKALQKKFGSSTQYDALKKTYILERARLRIKANDVLRVTSFVVLVPVLVLIFGWAVAWMLRGFRSK